jgi:hypothetical protein
MKTQLIQRKFIVAFCSAIFFGLVSGRTFGLTIDTTGAWDGSSEYSIFGGDLTSATKSFGQSFVLNQSASLMDFTFFLRGSSNPDFRPISFNFHIMSWDNTNSHPTGEILFSQINNTTDGSAIFQEFKFNTGGLNLLADTYVAFVTIAGETGLVPQSSPTGIGFGSMGGTFSDSYTDGQFVFDTFAAQQFSDLLGNTWNDFGAIDASFIANLQVIPVPAAAWLFGSGLLGLIGVSRRKKAS